MTTIEETIEIENVTTGGIAMSMETDHHEIREKIAQVVTLSNILREETITLKSNPTGETSWGDVIGTLSNQTDLNSALAGKEPTKGADDNFVTDAEKVIIGNTSGTNSGNNATNTQYSSLVTNATHTGEVTGATALTIANDVVTYAKMQNVSATDKVLGRVTAGAGDIEEITCTSAGRNLMDDLDITAQRTTLGLGSLATQNGTFSGTSSGTNTGDQASIVGITGTIAQFNTACSNADFTTGGGTATGTNTGDQDISTLMVKASNLSDVSNVTTAKTNLSLQNVDNTTDANKPVSTATQTALNLKANITSQTLITPVIGVATGTSLAVTGLITSSGTAGIGYATGAGGTVTQLTSKSTTVIINKLCGTITMINSALAAATIVTFTVTNSTVSATDVIHVQHDTIGAIGGYTIMPNTPAAGSFKISVRNNTAGSLSEAIVLRFAVIKAVAS